MNKITSLSQSPCSKCGMENRCLEKIGEYPIFKSIYENIMPRADFNYHNCSLYILVKAEEEENETRNK